MEKILPKEEDIREAFLQIIVERGVKQSWLADEMGLSRFALNNILHQRKILTEKNKLKLNELLKTDFE